MGFVISTVSAVSSITELLKEKVRLKIRKILERKRD